MSLILQSFRHYAKSHLGLLGGAFLTSAILSGSLLVGDSVRQSLRKAADQRLGKIQSGMLGGDRWFTAELARKTGSVPIILMNGSVSESTGRARVNAVQVCGVEEGFWAMSPSGMTPTMVAPAVPGAGSLTVVLNESLARKLGVQVGGTVLLRLEQPSAISRDAPLSGSTNEEVTMRRTVSAIVGAEDFGAFQLTASQTGSDTVFVPLKDLQESVEKSGMINASFFGRPKAEGQGDQPPPVDLDAAATLEDFSLKLKPIQGAKAEWQVTTDRVFIDDAIGQKLLKAKAGAYGVLTYLVNGLSAPKSTERTPYSMVTSLAALPSGEASPSIITPEGGTAMPATVTQWLADDLSLTPGATFDLRFFTVGIGRELKEQTATFTVQHILPMNDLRVNRDWTPEFPGVSDVDNCRDWQPGIPVKLDAIRDKDEKYWDDYRGTPKAFISLEAGQKLWGNRFGNLTSIRFNREQSATSLSPAASDPSPEEVALRKELVSHLRLADIGLVPRDFRTEAAAAAKGSVDFGGLFIGLSLFLVASALVFSALLFLFTLEKRAAQVGLLLAVGWTPKQVRRTVLGEAGLVALVGSAFGLLGGLAYTKLALAGLNGIWADATAGMKLFFHAQGGTLAIALISSLLTAMATLWFASRRMFGGRPKDLLVGEAWSTVPLQTARPVTGWMSALRALSPWLPIICLLMATGLSAVGSRVSNPQAMAGLFFAAGFLLLLAGLLAAKRWIRAQEAPSSAATTAEGGASSLGAIGMRNVARRPGRSMAVIGMMAGGIFLVIAVNAFRLSADADPAKRDSGTGGFALLGESTLPIYEDLNSEAAWDSFALDEKVMLQAKVVPFRVREGDDASCLNLNRAQNPVLCAVNPDLLSQRGAFKFAGGSWTDLAVPKSGPQSDDIPAIADQATALWGLGKGIGDTLTYIGADGKPFNVKLVGLLSGSVLQGKVVISEAAFLGKFPDTAGYKLFLLDALPTSAGKVSDHLTKQLQARGLAIEPVATRLAAFLAVQNTYIGIFTVLGGLGVLLGTAGLGVLVARNILERKGEFGLMQALGFLPAALRRMVLSEHVALLAAGLALGLVSAALAVWPNVQQSGGKLPVSFLIWLSFGILAFGVAVCWLAARFALRGKLLDAVRRE